MSTPARYWLVLAAFTATLYACGGRGSTPLPSVPQSASGQQIPDATGGMTPDFRRCAGAQRGWVFRGPCLRPRISRKGRAVRFPRYTGYTLTFNVPHNDARAGERVVAVEALQKAIGKLGGKPFPGYNEAILYFRAENPGRKIRFAKGQSASFEIAGDGAFGSCNAARLVNGKWVNAGAGKASGSNVTFVIPFAAFRAVLRAPAYFAFACESAPTPNPSTSPTSSPTTSPTSSATPPSYCAAFKSASGSAGAVNFNFQDNSGLGGQIVLYAGTGTNWLSADGTYDASAPAPLPLACYPKSTGGKGLQFAVPAGTGQRLYVAYAKGGATPIPNPLGGMSLSGPSLTYGGSYYAVPWFIVEYGTVASAIIDLSQVDDLSLPVEMCQSSTSTTCTSGGTGTVGVTSANYQAIFTAMEATPQYQNLAVTHSFNKHLIDLRIVAPMHAGVPGTFDFGTDWFYNLAYLKTPYYSACSGASTPLANGYLSCIMASYNTAPRLFIPANIGGVSGLSGDNYCAGSDNSSNFVFTDVGGATSCPGSPTPKPGTTPFNMGVKLFEYGSEPSTYNAGVCEHGLLFQLPFGTASVGPIFTTPDAFALWKTLAIDINRGAALSTSSHPVGGANPAPSDFFGDPFYNNYAQILHQYFDHNQAYALSYDDSGTLESKVSYQVGDAINVIVHPVPTAAATLPATTPTPSPGPSCSPLPTAGP